MTYCLPILVSLKSCVHGKRKQESGAGLPEIKRLIGGLYEFHEPDNGETPDVEVVFFHGLRWHGDASRAHEDTWISFDGRNSFYWPQKLLAAEFPRARIFSVSYDSCISQGPTWGRMDRHLVAENLLQDLTHRSGHRTHCPVILVGKDIGGLVIKSICLLAANNWGTNRERYQSFLRDIRGILYYCTPHRRFSGCPSEFDGAMFENLGFRSVDIARLSEDFNQLNRSTFKWRTKAILGNPSTETEELCIPEGSSRDGVEECYTVPHDLHDVARPRDRTDRTYSFLSELVWDAISQPSSSSEFESSLLFTSDQNYVPMENTIKAVREAFEKTNVVVLHGDSGTGKSCLARHYALWFEAVKKKDHGQSSPSPVVCYVSCGYEAVVVDTQLALLRTFNFQYSRKDFETFGIEETESPKMARLHSALVNHLRGLDALVVLDDVWKAKFLEKVLVQGKNLRYLITSRDADLWPDSQGVKIEDVTRDDGRQILANYAKFEDRCIPEHLQVQADELIQDVQSHPLALATLGAVLQYGDKFSIDRWRNVRDDLLVYLESDRYISVNCGESYPRSVSAALMLVVDDKFLDADTMDLLYVINLFQGPWISESLVRSFLTYTRPAALKSWDAKIRVLQALSLVQVQEWGQVRMVANMDDKLPIGTGFYTARHENVCLLFVHDLRQRFILQQKKGDMDKIIGFLYGNREFYSLERRSDDDWATVLCAISGVSTVRKEARQKMGCFYRWLDSRASIVQRLSVVLGILLGLLPASIEEHSFNNEPFHSCAMASKEVLWTFLLNCHIDFHRIALLIQEPLSMKWACCFLINVFGVLLPRVVNFGGLETEADIGGCANALIAVLSQDATENHAETWVETVLGSLFALLHYCPSNQHGLKDFDACDDWHHVFSFGKACGGSKKKEGFKQVSCRLDTKRLLHILIVKGFLAKDMKHQCLLSTLLIRDVTGKGCYACKAAVVKTHGCLDKLLELLGGDVSTDIQEVALDIFCNITSRGPLGYKGTTFAAVKFDLLSRVIPFLSPDLGRRCQQSIILLSMLAEDHDDALMIVSSASCLQKLMELLAKDVAATQQEAALSTLKIIAYYHKGMLYTTISSDFLSRIVFFLSQDLGIRCKLVISLLQSLAEASYWAEMIVKFPGCLEKVIKLLTKDATVNQQEDVLQILCNIVTHSVLFDENDMTFAAVWSDLLLRIVPFLSQDQKRRCELSALLISRLAKAQSCTAMIINSDNCLSRLIDLLAEYVLANLQNKALLALKEIAAKDIDCIFDAFEVDTTNLGQLSIRHVIEKQIHDKHKTSANICAALNRYWCYKDAIRGAYPAAISIVNKMLELDSEIGFWWQECGVLRGLMGDYLGALEDLNRALEIDIDKYECLKHRALVKFQLGNENEACVDAKRAILIKSSRVNNSSNGHECLGVLPVQFMQYQLK